jgi:hypothetical protein
MLSRMATSSSSNSTSSEALPNEPVQPYGIDGWLGYYVLSSIVFVPVLSFLITARTPSGLEHISPLLVAVSVVTGILLLLKKSYALFFVGADLAIRFVCDVYMAYRMLASPHPGMMFRMLFFNLAVILGWFLYFKTSRRVRNTLGRNL